MNLSISLLLSSALALFAYIKKAMTTSALLTAFLFAFIITYFGGVGCFIILTLVFLGVVVAGKIKTEKRREILDKVIEKPHQKDIYQILANVLLGTIALILYKITNNSIFLVVYASCLAESLSDSLASDIGVLSKKEPINIKTLKKSKPGLSGNISILGLFASLMGAFIIGLTYFLLVKHNMLLLVIITLSGFLGALIDSLLGATIQVKYECSNCKSITEQETHCNKPTKYIEGIKFINNDCVNFSSNLFSGLLTYFLLLLI